MHIYRKLPHYLLVIVCLITYWLASGIPIAQAQSNITSEIRVLPQVPLFTNQEFDRTMIKIFVTQAGIIYGFEVSGHSGYAEKGNDIVCAGVSTVAQNTVISLQTYTTDRVQSEIHSGYLKCILPDQQQGNGSLEASILLKSALMGFYLIERGNYSAGYVKMYQVVDSI